MLGPTGKPTLRLRAYTLREELLGRLERLQDLEAWLKDSARTDSREGLRLDAVTVAREHLQQAIDALELASRD